MAHPLQQRLAAVRRRVRLLIAAYGLGWLVLASIGVAVVLGLADYALRIEDRGLRLLGTLFWVGVSGAVAWRFLYVPLRTPLADVDLARQLQERFPALGDNLASAVEFLRLREDDVLAGSPALRRAVIHRTAAAAEHLDFAQALEARPIRRVLSAAGAIVLLAGAVVWASPEATQVAVARLLHPLGSVAWPQQYHLVVRNAVKQLARGQPFEVEVADAQGKPLPPQVRIFYRIEAAGGLLEEEELMRRWGQVATARRESVQYPFSYRAEGGDDRSMPWHRVEVVDAPELQALEITVVPPAYTGRPAEAGQRNLRVLAGSRLEMTAAVTQELAAAWLCLEDGRQFAATLGPDGRTFWVGKAGAPGVVVEQSGAYWFRLTSRQGLTCDTTRWDIRAVPDAPPQVLLEEPAGTLYVTPQAEVPIRIAVRDDLGIARVALRCTQVESGLGATKPAREPAAGEGPAPSEPTPKGTPEPAPQQAPAPEPGKPDNGTAWRAASPQPAVTVLYPPAAGAPGVEVHRPASPEGESLVLAYRWALAPRDLAPGTELILEAVASDFRPQTGRSQPRHLAIITPEELADRLATRQAALVAELVRAIELQRQARGGVEEVHLRIRHGARPDRADLDRLRSAELGQRQVSQVLYGPEEGLRGRIEALLAELTNNKIDSPDIQRRMQGARAELDRLNKEELAAIAAQFGSALKALQTALEEAPAGGPGRRNPSGPPPKQAAAAPERLVAPLTGVQQNQDRVVAALEKLREELQRWDSVRRFHRDLAQVLVEQQELADRTSRTARRTFSKELQDLTPEDRADLGVAAARQVDLAQRLERLEAEVEHTLPALRQSDRLASEAVEDALRRLRDLRISAAMREAAAAVGANQMGLGLGLQREIIDQLREVLDLLTNRREHELGRSVARLHQAESDLANLANRQAQVREVLEAAEAQKDAEARNRALSEAAARQKALQGAAEELARRLEHLEAQQASAATAEAAQHMAAAADTAAKHDAPGAAASARSAQHSLEEARRRVAEQARQSQVELAKQQLARLHQTVHVLHRRQEQILRRTQQLHSQQAATAVPDGWNRELAQLADQQKALASQTTTLARKQATSEAFAWTLHLAGQAMAVSAAWMERGRVDDPAQSAQHDALARLRRLLEALGPEASGQPADAKPSLPPGAPESTPPASPPPVSGVALRRLAEIRLLKLLQEDLNRQTAELDQAVQAGRLPPHEARRRYHDISQQQGRLAELLLAIGAPDGDEPEPAGQNDNRKP